MWHSTFSKSSCPRSSCLADGAASFGLRLRAAGTRVRLAGFTLIELLTVVGVIVLMTGLAIPAFNAIRGGTDFTSEVYNIAGMFDQARAYAMANNTFVLIGVAEVSAAQGTSASPQVSGTGRIAVAIVASENGTRPYQSLIASNNLGSWFTPTYYGTGSKLAPVTALMNFQNIHLVELQPPPSGTGSMARPPVTPYCDLSNAKGTSSTQFAWPLGSSTTSYQYLFSNVIEYDPQGSARIISTANTASYPNAVPLNLEIGIEPAHGTSASSQQYAAIQINGISGASHIYRQ